MKTTGLIEVILYVQNMATMVHFYRENFGLNVTFPTLTTEFQDEFWVTLDAGGSVLALHGGGKGRLAEDTPKLVFGVDDIHEARSQLLRNGVAIGEVRQAAPGILVCDGKDVEGHPFSIEAHGTE